MKDSVAWSDDIGDQVQGMALTGYDSNCAHHFVLRVRDGRAARRFVADLLADGCVAFGTVNRERDALLNIGFTYHGLEAIGVSPRRLEAAAAKSIAFARGAPERALERLGDFDDSAVEHWEEAFGASRAHVWIAVHADDRATLERECAALRARRGAVDAFDGWDGTDLSAAHLGQKDCRTVHFGFRDGLTKPTILETRSASGPKVTPVPAGELLVGYANASGFDDWGRDDTLDDVIDFFRNGSFGVFRKIEQDVDAFERYVSAQSAGLVQRRPIATPDYLKAKLCGRWPGSGKVVQPGEIVDPGGEPPQGDDDTQYDFRTDADGVGCPMSAHIRRANPRGDPVVPHRVRTLFRRGMPYGDAGAARRGLMGIFFCASIEDQFEGLVSEWLEKRPMGPRNTGRMKDPFVGNHDDPDAIFRIPRTSDAPIELSGFSSFVTTRGTLYAFFPARAALQSIAWVAVDDRSGRVEYPDQPTLLAAGAAPAAASTKPMAFEPDDAPADRFCDIVMEGGVTSGIIYAAAVSKLSTCYRFKNIGGSSIGAFAAALTAAAEYRRRRGSRAGFDALATLPHQLAKTDLRGRTLLERLFVPEPKTKRLYAIFIAALDRETWTGRALHGATEALRQYRRWLAVVLLVVFAFALPGLVGTAVGLRSAEGAGPAVAQVLATLAILGTATIGAVLTTLLAGVVYDFARGVVPNGFGLCRGWSEDTAFTDDDLAGYLHKSIQAVAGRHPLDQAPLTFHDLWRAPGDPATALGITLEGAATRSINLEVYATNLTYGRPYRFPLDEAGASLGEGIDEDMSALYFEPAELAKYFPEVVLNHLIACSTAYGGSDPTVSGLRRLPTADLPIVVAARLAMSFPLLVSAVRLWAIDFSVSGGRRRPKPVWMSDGGLCSNFPIHLFDAFLPRWPTFGISLRARGVDGDAVWLPPTHRRGRSDARDAGLDDEQPALSRLGGFLVSLWYSAWRWNDSTMERMPGVRDRVVRLYLKPNEGGVNIRMTGQEIEHLSSTYGTPAADAFIDKFAGPASRGWDEHRWVRFNTLLLQLRDRVLGIGAAADLDRHGVPLAAQIDAALRYAPLGGGGDASTVPSETPIDPAQADALRALLDALRAMESALSPTDPSNIPYVALPRPSLRSRHPT